MRSEPCSTKESWLAIDRSDTENSCLRIVPGSHDGFEEKKMLKAEGDNLLAVRVEVSPEQEAQAVDLVLMDIHMPEMDWGPLWLTLQLAGVTVVVLLMGMVNQYCRANNLPTWPWPIPKPRRMEKPHSKP